MAGSGAPAKPYRISDPIPRNWEDSNEMREFRHFMSDLHFWMQAWSDEGETMLVSIGSSDKLDINTLSVDCTEEEFRTIEASLYQVLHRTTTNEPRRTRTVQQTKGQKGFEAWRGIVSRCDQRNMSGNNHLNAIDEDDSENVEEATDNEEDLQAWCLLEENEDEQWQEVISRRDKQKVKKEKQASLLIVENSQNSNSKTIIEEKDR